MLLYLMCHNMDLICDWLQDKDIQFFQSETLYVRNMFYSGILEVVVPKECQQSGWKWNVAHGNKNTTDKVYREKSQRDIKKYFMSWK